MNVFYRRGNPIKQKFLWYLEILTHVEKQIDLTILNMF